MVPDSNQPNKDKSDNIHISDVASGREQSEPEIAEVNQSLPVVKPSESIVTRSEQAWLAGTQTLQQNLIGALQEYQSGLFAWRERGILAQKRQEMIHEVTQHYIRFLREEARITSDAALQARRARLQKQLFELKADIYSEIASMAGLALGEIEGVFKTNFGKLSDPEIQRKYAEFVMNKVADLLDTKNLA